MAVPLVSAIIPTYERPRLVVAAATSALSQTMADIEAIVVLAGPDEETEHALSGIADPRLRVLPSLGGLSPSAARNRGIQAARGQWIALLDDDDEWLPDKVRRQHAIALRSAHRQPIVSCGMLVRDGRSERLWPRRLPRAGESAADYLFRRKTVLGACGFLQTSTIFAGRELFLAVPFREDLCMVEDLDWVLRAATRDHVGVEFVLSSDGTRAEPLSVWNIDAGRPHESSAHGWADALNWIRENRDLVGAEAYASYLLTRISRDAARSNAGVGTFRDLWREAARLGRPSALDRAVHVGHWLIPHTMLESVSGWLTRQRRTPAARR